MPCSLALPSWAFSIINQMFQDLSATIFFYCLETLGIISFFVSGALLAKQKDFDPVGVYVIGFVTALGGGSIRDIMLDHHPLYWIQHSEYPLAFLILTGILYYAPLTLRESSLLIPDAFGIALFGVTSTQLAMGAKFPVVVVAIIAVVSSCFGGVLRDLLCTQTPYLFRKGSFYATVVFCGSVLYVGLDCLSLNAHYNAIICVFFMSLFRVLAFRFNWRFR